MDEKSSSYFSIYSKDSLLYIKNNPKEYCLQINFLDLTLSISEEKENFGKKISDCYGIIGIIILESYTYLILITKANLVCSISDNKIYKVLDTQFIKLSDDNNSDDESEEKSENNSTDENKDNELIDGLKEKFKTGFYFSNTYDLANSLTSQNQIKNFYAKEKKDINEYDYILEGNKNFLSNYKLTCQVMSIPDNQSIKFFFSNCIYGNIEEFNYEKEKLQIILISRRHLWNFGIFAYRRGLSKYGGNSNQIETELLLIYDNKDIYSNIHLSGYLPIYFKSKKNIEMNDANRAFIKYIKTLIDEYNFLFLFAIKNDEKDEKYINKLKVMLRLNIKSIANKWKYFCINSHENKCIKNNIENKNIIENIGFNVLKDNFEINPDKTQDGIITLFGMDNKSLNQNELNLIYLIIHNIIQDLNSEKKCSLFLEKDINLDLYQDDISSGTFINNLKLILKNRDKELSSQYYTNYSFELNKKYQRIYEILFGKNMKFSPIKTNLNEHREEFSDTEKLKFYVATWNTSTTDLSKNTSFNLDALLIPKDPKIIPDMYFLGFQEVIKLNATNIIITGEEKLQQILNDWDKKVMESLQKIGKYKKLVAMNLVGINFYSYILEDKFDKVKNISKKIVKTGFGGTTGNKGSCVINFDYENTSFSISCSHLVANNKNKRLKELVYILNLKLNTFYNPEKLKDKNDQQEITKQTLEEIMSPEDDTIRTHSISVVQNPLRTHSLSVVQNPLNNPPTLQKNENNNNSNDSLLFKDTDIWILFGDLNFRVDMDYEEFSEFIKNGNSWDKLLEYDQFVKYKKASLSSVANIEESLIKFAPTYKYIINSDEFDYTPKEISENPNPKEKEKENLHKSGKKRNPSWCDRIFYKKNAFMTKEGKKIISGYEYGNVMDKNFRTSDHRPVYQIFDIIIFKENPEKKELIEKEIFSNEALGISNKYMKQKIYDF